MSLIPKIRVCLASNCSALTYSELTGVYDSVGNTGGYGTPNVDINNIVTATLTVVDPSDNSYEIIGLTPTTNPSVNTTINLSDLGNRSSIEDGYWQFVYTLLDDENNTYTATKSYYFYCNTECCVNKLLSKISITDSINVNAKVSQYIIAKTFLDSLINSANCLNTANFNEIKAFLDKLCKNKDCKSCK